MRSAIIKKRIRIGVLLTAVLLFGTLTALLTLGAGAHPMHCPAVNCDMLWNYENGFCLHCGAFEEPYLNPGETEEAHDDYYEIANAGNLYWLAAYINRTAEPTTINAKLTANITVNKDLLGADGTPTEGEKRAWTPIGAELTCNFLQLDGDGYFVSGLYAVSEDEEGVPVGFIATAAHVTVKNLGICDSYFASLGTVGGIIAVAEDDCVVENCFVQATVKADVYGGIVGSLQFATTKSVVTGCYTTAGAVVNSIAAENELENCYYCAQGETDEQNGTTHMSAAEFTSGALLAALDSEECHWYESCLTGMPQLRYHHLYNLPCDAECQMKAECVNREDSIREVTHVFENDCDTTCEVCKRIRQVGDHRYQSSCDTTCDSCGEVREAGAHAYSTPCDATCNNCPHTREVPDHVYDGDCDPDCNNCGMRRENVGAHTFDNSCDTICNGCGVFREGGHEYTNTCDEFCNICNAKRTIKHTYGEFVVTREATEFEAGEKVKTCTVCGATVTEEIPPIIKIPLGALIAIVLGGSAVLVFGGYAIIYLIRKKKK
ncbi:MAG: hypothetical protein E7624_05915 [Ruminococcaceae bacterium]|nr:hypothetical protein [Oscillospiraceae bacterium]